jgi:hypothetical protein
MLIQDTGYWMLDTGYWILETGYWKLDTGNWILDAKMIKSYYCSTKWSFNSIYRLTRSTSS